MLVQRICGSRHYFLWRTTVNLRCSQIYFQPCSYSISNYKDVTFANHYRPSFHVKYFSTSSIFCEKEKLKPSSLVEETVDSMREEERRKQDLVKRNSEKRENNKDLVSVSGEQKKEIAKKSLWARFVGELKHYYHGFRLLYIESKIAFGFAWKMLKGESLSRREHKQLVRTTADLFRLVPFSVFIIIPFMELLLPVFVKLFPSMLPSTFQSANEKEAKVKANLKLKLEMARFLQQTLDDMALKGKGRESERAREFVEFFNRVRTSGEAASNEEIMRFSKLFEDEITLESLTRPQLLALCRLLEIQPMGTNNFLRFQLQLKLRSLAADDKVIQKEGLESLTASELQAACRARGMRSHGFPAERLRQQLTQWLDLSLNEKVPPSLLLLSRTLYLPESVPTTDQLKATISSLPESITIPTEDAIAEKEGRIDNVVRLKLIKEEQEKIKAEREEQKKMEAEKKKKGLPEVLVDVAPMLQDRAKVLERKKEEEFSSDDLAALEDALENVGVENRKLLLEKEELSEIKKELQDYEEDLKDLDKFMKSSGQPPQFLRESKAARRLYKRVNNIIGNLDALVHSLEKNKKILKEEVKTVSAENGIVYDELVSVTELIQAIKKLQRIDDDVKLEKIEKVLGKLDTDRDGSIKVDDVMKVIEMIGKEHFDLSGKQISDIIDMLHKEGEITREITMFHPGKAKLFTKESPPAGSSDSLTSPQPIRYREKSGIVINANVTPKMKEQMEMNVEEKLKHGQTVETKNVFVSLEEDNKKVKIEVETLGDDKAEEKLKDMIPPPKQIDEKNGDKENRV